MKRKRANRDQPAYPDLTRCGSRAACGLAVSAALAAGCGGAGQEGGRAWADTGLTQGGEDGEPFVLSKVVLPGQGVHRLEFSSGWLEYRLHLSLSREDYASWLEENPTLALSLADQLLVVYPLSAVAKNEELGPFEAAIAQILADVITGTDDASTEAFTAVGLQVLDAVEAIPGDM